MFLSKGVHHRHDRRTVDTAGKLVHVHILAESGHIGVHEGQVDGRNNRCNRNVEVDKCAEGTLLRHGQQLSNHTVVRFLALGTVVAPCHRRLGKGGHVLGSASSHWATFIVQQALHDFRCSGTTSIDGSCGLGSRCRSWFGNTGRQSDDLVQDVVRVLPCETKNRCVEQRVELGQRLARVQPGSELGAQDDKLVR